MRNRCIVTGLILALLLGTIGCSDDPADPGGGGDAPETVAGTWYIDNAQIDFKPDRTYATAMRVNGSWVVDESGIWSYDATTKLLTATVKTDNNGSWGLGDGQGATLAVLVASISQTSLVINADGELVALSSTGSAMPGGTIRDSFDGSSVNSALWYKEVESGTSASVGGGTANLSAQGNNGSARAKLELNGGGFRSVQAAIRVDAIVHGSGGSSGELAWSPYGEDYVLLGIQASPGNTIHITASYESGYTIVSEAQFGVTYNLKMIWTGSRVEFYVNGNLMKIHVPPSSAIIFDNTHPPKIKAYASSGGYVSMKGDDFLAEF